MIVLSLPIASQTNLSDLREIFEARKAAHVPPLAGGNLHAIFSQLPLILLSLQNINSMRCKLHGLAEILPHLCITFYFIFWVRELILFGIFGHPIVF